MERRKRIIIRISAILTGVLLIITFFSGTLYSINLPEVKVGIASSGVISTTYQGYGVLDFYENISLHANHTGRINFAVQAGDWVQPDDMLFSIYVDTDNLRKRLASENFRLERAILMHTRAQTLLDELVLQPGQRRLYESERSRLQHDIDLLYIDVNEILHSIEGTARQIDEGGLIAIYAKYPGIVREIAWGLENDMYVEFNRFIMRIGVQSSYYAAVVYFPESVGILPNHTSGAAPDNISIRVDISSHDDYGLSGGIRRMYPYNGQLRAEITFLTRSSVSGGEAVRVTVEISAGTADFVLPNSAIREDAGGSFILYLERERNALMGYSYVAREMRVRIGARGGMYSSLMTFPEAYARPVILLSDRPITPGDRVRVVADR